MTSDIEGLETAGGPDSDDAGLAVGSQLGRYTLTERIGEGAFGVVYRAEQSEPVRRDVALKVIKLGMDTKEVIARFEAERQALALMEHPNISQVYDAGTTDRGRPYFVMELVRGVPITTYCDQETLGVRARLKLFETVCHGLQHAHQKGVIHRDIKPTNVLVTQQDGVPVPKIIDFGIAKATDQRLTERTLMTEQHQLIGTPEYMAPEQADISDHDVDTRADIYSLGILLYELLTGSQPHDLHSLFKDGLGAVLHQIREVDPPTPSTRITQMSERALAMASDQRRIRSGKLARVLAGDLDWIVMKAIDKDRSRRYETANAFAMDLERYRKNEPVRARPPTAAYRLRKYVRRHRTGVVAAAAAGIAIIVGATMALQGYLRGERQLQRALRAESLAQQQKRDADRARGDADQRAREARTERDAKAEALAKLEKTSADLKAADEERATVMKQLEASLAETDAALRRARALGLVNASSVAENEDPMRALLLAREAAKLSSVPEVLAQLRSAIRSSRERAQFRGHRGEITSIQISPGGKHVVTTSHDYIARLWDMAGNEIDFFSHNGPVFSADFSPDGQRVVTAAGGREDGTGEAMIWRVDDGERVARLRGHEGVVRSALYSPDGTRILTASTDGTARLWDAQGELLATLRVSSKPGWAAVSATFSADGQRILTASDTDGALRTWDLSGRRLSDERVEQGDWRPDRVFFQLGDRLVFVSQGGTTSLRDYDGKELAVLDRPARALVHVAESADGTRFLTCCDDGTARLWDRAGKSLAVLRGHQGAVRAAAFSLDGTRIATSSDDGSARVWSLSGDELSIIRGPVGAVTHVLFPTSDSLLTVGSGPVARLHELEPREVRHDEAGVQVAAAWTAAGARFLVPFPDGTAQLLDETDKEIARLGVPGSQIEWGLFSADGSRLLTGSDGDPVVRLWDTQGRLLASAQVQVNEHILNLLRSTAGSVDVTYGLRVAFDPKAERFLTMSPIDNTIRVWNFEAKEVATVPKVGAGAMEVAFWPGRDWVVVTYVYGIVKIFDLKGQAVHVLGNTRTLDNVLLDGEDLPASLLAFSSNGQLMLFASLSGVAELWHPEHEVVRSFRWKDTRFRRVTMSPEGRHVLAAMTDKSAYLWDLEGNPPAVFQGHDSLIDTLAFSPSGDVVATGGRRSVRLWDRAGKLIDVLGGHEASVQRILFSPDGRAVHTITTNGTRRRFLRRTEDLLALAAKRTTRAFTDEERRRYAALLSDPGPK